MTTNSEPSAADVVAAAVDVELQAAALGVGVLGLRRARTRLERAQKAHDKAVLSAAEKRSVVEDRAGAIDVTEAPADDVAAEPSSTSAQQVAAREAVAKARRAHERALARVEQAERDIARTGEQLTAVGEALELAAETTATALTQMGTGTSGAPEDDENAADPEPLFATLPEFVKQIVAVLYAADFPTGAPRRWCGQWWMHPPVVFRLEALWRAFEHLRLDPTTGMSVFLRDHADPHMAWITSPDGPLARCKPLDHQDGDDDLVLIEPDDGLYTPENT